jgi:hypothetical protein
MGRPRLSEFTEEEQKLYWIDRQERLERQERLSERNQIRAALSEEELRDVKRFRNYAREGARGEIWTWSDGSVKITLWPHSKERK